jgi:hypothetical protein
MTKCGCERLGSSFSLRQPDAVTEAFLTFDSSNGFTQLPDGTFRCPECGAHWSRTVEEASMFHDYDEYYFTRIT